LTQDVDADDALLIEWDKRRLAVWACWMLIRNPIVMAARALVLGARLAGMCILLGTGR